MFENAIANIKRSFKASTSAVQPRCSSVRPGKKPSPQENFKFLKLKFSKSDTSDAVADCESDITLSSLSPRAVGFAECARTEVEWPAEPEHNRNILDKFTDIVNERSSPRTTRKRNDREEIRRRLALAADGAETPTARPGRKPSLHSRLQSVPWKMRPTSLQVKPSKSRSSHSLSHIPLKESDFHTLQATLQTEARIALAQAKEMARIHMEKERRCRDASPVTDMLRRSLDKANCPLAADRRRVSRQILTDMNIAQLQVIVNSLHGEVELLSERLVQLLMERDELHMGQDSMLVDIEDLTRYLGIKEQNNKNGAVKGGVRRLTSLMQKQHK